jgi:hypothetical protein
MPLQRTVIKLGLLQKKITPLPSAEELVQFKEPLPLTEFANLIRGSNSFFLEITL